MKTLLLAVVSASAMLAIPMLAEAQSKRLPPKPKPATTTASTATPERPVSTRPNQNPRVYMAVPAARQPNARLNVARSDRPLTRPRSNAVVERPGSGVASRPSTAVTRSGATGSRSFRKPRPRAGDFTNAVGRDPARDGGDFTDQVGDLQNVRTPNTRPRAGDFGDDIGRDPARDGGDFSSEARPLQNIRTPGEAPSSDGFSDSSDTLTPEGSTNTSNPSLESRPRSGSTASTVSSDSAISLDPPSSATLGADLPQAAPRPRGTISESRTKRPPE